MTPELKAKWIAALRSGEYRQGKKRLRHSGRYCCLGVLCEVAGEPIKRLAEMPNEDFLIDRVGLRGGEEYTLADMNDHRGLNFAQIADWIEANL